MREIVDEGGRGGGRKQHKNVSRGKNFVAEIISWKNLIDFGYRLVSLGIHECLIHGVSFNIFFFLFCVIGFWIAIHAYLGVHKTKNFLILDLPPVLSDFAECKSHFERFK